MYNYEKEKRKIFTEEGQVMFLSVRDKVNDLLRQSGAVRMQEVISGEKGDVWTMLACVDRLIELREIREITGRDAPGQHRVFVSNQE